MLGTLIPHTTVRVQLPVTEDPCMVQNLATECEIEEEYLVNNLQKRIGKLHTEKTQLEQILGVLQRKVSINLSLAVNGSHFCLQVFSTIWPLGWPGLLGVAVRLGLVSVPPASTRSKASRDGRIQWNIP